MCLSSERKKKYSLVVFLLLILRTRRKTPVFQSFWIKTDLSILIFIKTHFSADMIRVKLFPWNFNFTIVKNSYKIRFLFTHQHAKGTKINMNYFHGFLSNWPAANNVLKVVQTPTSLIRCCSSFIFMLSNSQQTTLVVGVFSLGWVSEDELEKTEKMCEDMIAIQSLNYPKIR